MSDITDKLILMESAVLRAAAHILKARSKRSEIEVFAKPDHTIVMNLDIECQKIISQVLNGKIPVLGEEDDASHTLLAKTQDYFVVDPIDGTASCKRYLEIEGGQLGFGPLVGFVEAGKLKAATYYNIPARTIYSAISGAGAYAQKIGVEEPLPIFEKRRKLGPYSPRPLQESALLFYPGSVAELRTIMYLRTNGYVENTYRFGGFANDSIRVAEDFEQLQLQSRVKAWDFSAVMIAAEAGLRVIVDPFGKRIELRNWTLQESNPVLIAHPSVADDVLLYIDKSLA